MYIWPLYEKLFRLAMNTLYLGDCLYVLRENIRDESVDLIYIDPPFNSKRDYNIFFDDKEIHSQRIAFEDTWTLKNIQDSLAELHTMEHENLWSLLTVYQKVAPHAFPYLVMMALRFLELHRVLKPTGSLYIHCDQTMSHYLKTLCDLVFEESNFRNEISWKRTFAHGNVGRNYGSIADTILFYTKSDQHVWNQPFTVLTTEEMEKKYPHCDPGGRRWQSVTLRNPGVRPNLHFAYRASNGITYHPHPNGWSCNRVRLQQYDREGRLHFPTKANGALRLKMFVDESEGEKLQNIWDDIPPIGAQAAERLGYPTQKPKALLERIIGTSSNEGDAVLDAFCGCGTTIDAAEGLLRNWIGIDVSPIAISLIKRRLHRTYKKGLSEFEIRGIPTDEQSAHKLWKENPFAFQDWWISEFDVFSSTYGTKGSDKGVDGIGLYAIDNKGTTLRVAFQVKGGDSVQSKDMDALIGAMSKHKCELGIFFTVAEPTKSMIETVANAGFVTVPGFEYPKVQILTLKEFFAGNRPKLPAVNITFKSAEHTGKRSKSQINLGV